MSAKPLMDTAEALEVLTQVFNEEKTLQATLSNLLSLQPPVHEIVVADGGSTDQ